MLIHELFFKLKFYILGNKTTIWGSLILGSTPSSLSFSSNGIAYANVFPDPVLSYAIRSYPSIIG